MQKAPALELLSAYAAIDEREAGYRLRMLRLLEAEAPFSRSHFEPGHFTASAIVLSPERDSVLLIFHKKLERWLQPGGHVELEDADFSGAARREVAEETGIRDLEADGGGILDLDIHAIPGRTGEPAHEHFDVRFSFVAASREFEKTDEVAAARWVSRRDVEKITPDASVLRALSKIRWP